MKDIWKLLNSPLVVVMIALFAWPIITVFSGTFAFKLGVNEVVSAISDEIVQTSNSTQKKQQEKLKKEIEIFKDVEIRNIGYAHSIWPDKMKIIGTIVNNSDTTLTQVHLACSFYKDGKLVDVKDEWISEIKALGPGGAFDFNFHRDVGEGNPKEELKVKIKLSDFKTLI